MPKFNFNFNINNSSNVFFSGNVASVNDNKVIVDDVEVLTIKSNSNISINITVLENCGDISTGSGDIKVYGNCKEVKTGSGDIQVKGSVIGDLKTGSGDITITGGGKVNTAKTGCGDINIS